MMKNVLREAGGALVIIDIKELSGLQGKLACLQVTDLIFGLKIYREMLLYDIVQKPSIILCAISPSGKTI